MLRIYGMGNLKSFEKSCDNEEANSYTLTLPSNAKAWSLLYRGDLEGWIPSAGRYGFDNYPHSCVNAECDRQAVCLQYIKADLNKWKKNIIIKRNNGNMICIPYPSNKEFKNLIDIEGYQINQAALAIKDSLALLLCKYSSDFVWHSVFPLVDLDKKEIKCLLMAPERNMTILQSKISSDLSKTAIVYYYSKRGVPQAFSYDLFLYANETGQILETIILNRNVDPHIAFDPRCDWSRMAVLGYNMCEENQENDMVILSLSDKKVLTKGKLSPMQTFGRGHFNILYSKDGNLLILHKLTSGRYADTYIFDSDELNLLKYLTATLPGMLRTCGVSYEPVFSKCGSLMRLVDHEFHGNKYDVIIQVFQLPRVLNLQFQSRIVILKSISSVDEVEKLSLPKKLVKYLKFQPTEI